MFRPLNLANCILNWEYFKGIWEVPQNILRGLGVGMVLCKSLKWYKTQQPHSSRPGLKSSVGRLDQDGRVLKRMVLPWFYRKNFSFQTTKYNFSHHWNHPPPPRTGIILKGIWYPLVMSFHYLGMSSFRARKKKVIERKCFFSINSLKKRYMYIRLQ